MSNLPLVSICIPAFNSEEWIEETVQSALNQTWLNKEIIIVDDGSDDNTWNIIESYYKKYPTIIKAFKQENKGACAARNFAFEMSSGEYIQWLDADDILAPDKIEIQMNYALSDKNSNILYCGKFGSFRKDIKNAKFKDNSLWKDLTPYQWMINYLGDVLMTQPGAWLISRNLIEITGPWNESLIKNQDGEYIFRLVSNCEFIKFTSDAIVYYRSGIPGSISKNYNQEAIDSVFRGLKNCIELLSTKYPLTNEIKNAIQNALRVFINKNFYSAYSAIQEAMDLMIKFNGEFNLPPEPIHFRFIKKLFGIKTALYLKNLWWNFKLKTGIGEI